MKNSCQATRGIFVALLLTLLLGLLLSIINKNLVFGADFGAELSGGGQEAVLDSETAGQAHSGYARFAYYNYIDVRHAASVIRWMWATMAILALPFLALAWHSRKLTVTLVSGECDRRYFQWYKHGECIHIPKAFHMDDHCIAGWYSDRDFSPGSEWNFNEQVRRDLTLYAKYVPKMEMFGLMPHGSRG